MECFLCSAGAAILTCYRYDVTITTESTASSRCVVRVKPGVLSRCNEVILASRSAVCEGMITMFHNLIGIHEQLMRCNDAKTLEVSKF